MPIGVTRRKFWSMGFDSKTSRPFPEHDDSPPPILLGSVWMAGVALVLSLVPLPAAFVGGLVGGWLVGSPLRGFSAAMAGAVLYAFMFRYIPYAGVFRLTSTDANTTIVLSVAAMVFGGVVAGALAQNRKASGRRMA